MKVRVIGITAISILVSFESCKKEPTVPSLFTLPASEVKQTSALSGGTLIDDGGAEVTAQGICWSTIQNPTVVDQFTSEDLGKKEFKSTMTGLSAGTAYYVRAYATNSSGTGYGLQESFTTSPATTTLIIFNPDLDYGSVSDNDGNTYKTIQIGTQIWMAENLKTTKYNDGSPIPNPTTWSAWENSTLGAYCWYENDPDYKAVYGALYQGRSVLSGKLCPAGWHIPEMSEFNTLVDYLGGKAIAAGKLKETGTIHWESPNEGATNESGFTAVPGGYNVSINVHFYDLGSFNFLWITTIEGVNRLGSVQIHHNQNQYMKVWASIDDGMINSGYSVRCIKD